jgi:hypothetical protein
MAGIGGGTGRRPLPLGEAIAAVSGLLLFVFLFLPWFGAGSGFGSGSNNASGWEIYSLADIVLAIIGLGAVALAAIGFFGANVRLPVARPRLLKWLAVVALTIVLTTAIELSTGDPGKLFDIKIGAILAVLAAIGLLAGAILAERPELAARLAAGAGGGGGAVAAQPQQPPVGGAYSGPAGGGATSVGTAQPPPVAPQPTSPAQQTPPPRPQAAAPPAAPPTVAPDWYPDPRGEKRLRYWDGTQWTDHTAD